MLCSNFRVFNYRLIVINILIYDLITTETVIGGNTDKSSTLRVAKRGAQISTSAIFISANDADSDDSDMVDDNCFAINENVDNFQNERRSAHAAYRANMSTEAEAITTPTTTAAAEVHRIDLLSTALMKNSTVTMAKSTMPPTTLTLAPTPTPTSPPLPSPAWHSFPASSASTKLSSLSLVWPSKSSLPVLQSSPLRAKWQRILSRPKRYLAFPEGSSFSVAVCFTVGIIGNPRYNYMSFGLNWGVAYDLPNSSWILNHLHGFSRHPVPLTVLRRRSRRSLYTEIENVVENMGYNGRDCVLRALCESRQYFQKTKMTMIGEMLRVIFSLPKQRLFTRELRENADIEVYDHAYRKARSVNCSQRYDCSFSLLELAFGKYSKPPPDYYKVH